VYIKSYTIRIYHLLILDSYKSHNSLEFRLYYKENKIITIYIPVYLLHLLQPLDIGYFSPIKRAYRCKVKKLIRVYINYITKTKFLLAFKAVFNALFTKSNIYASF
jgi:hypothetical protein